MSVLDFPLEAALFLFANISCCFVRSSAQIACVALRKVISSFRNPALINSHSKSADPLTDLHNAAAYPEHPEKLPGWP